MKIWRAALGVGASIVMALVFASAASANHNLIQHASTGSTDPNSAENIQTTRISASGNTVIFNSGQALVPEDTDSSQDVFARRGGETFLVSAGEINGTGAFPAGVLSLSDNGLRIWFETREQLVPGDTDSNLDVYERYQGQTLQVSAGAINGNQGVNSVFQGSSPDGARVYFRTIEQLTTDDVDGCGDIYERSGGVTTLVSGGKFECHGGSPIPISMVGYADTTDGPAVFVETSYRLIAADPDALTDVYEVVDGEFRLLSQGPGTSGTPDIARVVEISAQAHAVLIWSAQPLTSDDLDSRRDLFLSQNNSLARVSKGPIGGNGDQDVFGVGTEAGISADGEHVYFSTNEQLTADDTESSDLDLYEYDVADDTTRLIGNGALFRGASADGSTVAFLTSAALVPGDADGGFTDIYEDEGGVITHVSTGNSPTSAIFSGISVDGRRIFFLTEDSNSPNDTNGARDLYEHFDGALHLLSRDSAGLAGGAIAVGGVVVEEYRKGLAPDGLNVAFTSVSPLLPSDTDSNIDIYVAARSDPYPRPKAATPISVALVPAYATCTSPNRVHAAPLSFGSCSPPDHLSPTLTVGTGDGSLAFARSVGSVRINALPGVPGGVDDADVRIRLSITNVMRKSDLSDYTGELGVDLSFQLTDREGVVTQTSTPSAGSFTAPCTATASTIDGATCAVDTTVEALIPNAITEGARAIFELGPIEVRDGGTDEDADTPGDDGLLATQGVFVP